MLNPAIVRPFLATDRVRFVGEPVAVVVAERPEQGVDAAESVWVDIDPLAAVVDPEQAATDDVLVHPDAGTNVAVEFDFGHDDDLFDGCEVVVRQRIVNQRLAAVPLEGAVVGGGVGRRRPAPHVLLDAERPRRPRRARQRLRAGRRADPRRRPRRRRRLRSEDRRLARGPPAAVAGPPRRPPGPVDRDPHREPGGHGPRAGPGAATSRSAAAPTGPSWPTGCRYSRTPAPTRRSAPSSPYLTRSMAPGTYAIPKVECNTGRRSSPTRRRPSPTAAPAGPRRRRPSSGRSTCSPPRSGSTPSTCGAATSSPPFDAPAHHADRHDVRLRRLRQGPRRRPRRRRLRRRCGPSRPRRRDAGDAVALGIGVSTYVEVDRRADRRRRAGAVEVESDGVGDRVHRHVAPRPGPRHGLLDDRQRRARHPDGADPGGARRHRPRAQGRRDRSARARCSSAAPP